MLWVEPASLPYLLVARGPPIQSPPTHTHTPCPLQHPPPHTVYKNSEGDVIPTVHTTGEWSLQFSLTSQSANRLAQTRGFLPREVTNPGEKASLYCHWTKKRGLLQVNCRLPPPSKEKLLSQGVPTTQRELLSDCECAYLK